MSFIALIIIRILIFVLAILVFIFTDVHFSRTIDFQMHTSTVVFVPSINFVGHMKHRQSTMRRSVEQMWAVVRVLSRDELLLGAEMDVWALCILYPPLLCSEYTSLHKFFECSTSLSDSMKSRMNF